jgi:hypothetical protein
MQLYAIPLPAPEPGEVGAGEVKELVAALRADAECVTTGQPDLMQLTGQQLTRIAEILKAFILGGWIVPTVEQVTPPAPEQGDVGELVGWLNQVAQYLVDNGLTGAPHVQGAAILLEQQKAELAALRGMPVAVSERLRIVRAGIRAGYNLGHHHTVEGGWGDPDDVADDIAQETLDDLPAPHVGEVEA